jgi:hypothetical protein
LREERTLSDNSSLEPILRAVEPAVRLIPERYLRQVLQYLIDWGHPLPTNPHQPYWVSRSDLEASDILPPHLLVGAEPDLLLITDPEDRMIERKPFDRQLREYWRVLFRAAVMRAIDLQAQAAGLDETACLARLQRFGPPAAREVRAVLVAEHLVAPEVDAVGLYKVFAAVYLDLDAFEPRAVAHYFPSLPAGGVVRAAVAEDVDGSALLARTRPAGSAEPRIEAPPDEYGEAIDAPASTAPAEEEPRGLFRRAWEAEGRGNHARAAILRMQAAGGLSGDERAVALRDAEAALGKLVERVGDVFHWDGDTRLEWRRALAPLLEPAARGVWPRAARCLYELQKIPADLSREVYAVDLPEVIRTFGRRPLKRHLPHARPVLILMSLKKAYTQMLRAGVSEEARKRLDRSFHHQIHAVEHDIRRDFTPIVVAALAKAGLTPANTVEEVARDKLVAELLDRVCDRGYLRIGNLRDAIARNRLKMDDLTGAGELFRGDSLLRADIALAEALDGVYRKGEFYLRWIQRASALFFGTSWGRLFTLYVAVPFGGAFMALMFMEELRHIGGKIGTLITRPAATAAAIVNPQPDIRGNVEGGGAEQDIITPDELDVDEDGEVVWVDLKPGTVTSDQVGVGDDGNPLWLGTPHGAALVTDVFTSSAPATPQPAHAHGSILIAWPTILGFGVFLLLMFHVPPVRRAVFAVLGAVWRAVRGLIWDIPMGVWRSPAVRGFRQSRAVRFLVRHFWSPLLITILLFATMLLVGIRPLFLLKWGVWIWAALTLAYNTPWGWVVQDRVAEAISDWWRIVRVNLIPGLIATIIDWFKMLANWVERQLYAVDEWLRFRGGDSQGSLALKALLGLLWFPIAYVFRFVFYLLVEPQVNPVKHFPVVTVSHKVIWPMVPQLVELTNLSVWTVSTFINGIPGIFGFIAWELKENWRLYKANRAPRLKPVMIGSHGESMRGLLRPGFHSGTVPKLFRKLRHAGRARASWLHHDLDHAAEGVERFVERELVELVARSPDWGNVRVTIADIRFGCQRAVVELAAENLGRDALVMAFENMGGGIEFTLEEVGWADKLTEPQRAVFVLALRGLLDMAAVESIDGRPRVEAVAPLGAGLADLGRRVAWTEWVERWDHPAGTADLPA